MSLESGELCYLPAEGLVEPGEDLRHGMWPRSLAVWMAALYVALFIIRPWEQLFPWLQAIRFERTYALTMIGVVVLTRGFRVRASFQTVGVVLFTLSLGISGLLAKNPSLAWDIFYKYLTLVIFYVIMLSVIRTPYELMFIVASYIVTMGAYLGKSQWEYWVHGAHRYDMGVIRMVGIESSFGGPNNLAMSIVVSLPVLLFLYRIRDDLCRDWPQRWRKWFVRGLAIYAVLAGTSIILTNSRSGMLSAVLFVLLVAFAGKGLFRKFLYVAGGAVLLMCIWLVMPEENKGRFRTIWDPESGPANAQTSAEGREAGFWAGIAMFKRSPVTGVGIGNFIEYRVRYIDGVGLNAHNLPGQLLGEAGVLGGAAFLLMAGATLVNCRRVKLMSRSSPDGSQYVLSEFGIAVRISMILLAFTGLFGHNIYRFNWLWLAAFCTLAVEFANTAARRQHAPQSEFRMLQDGYA